MSQRRPIWMPGLGSRVSHFFREINLKHAVLAILLFPPAFYLFTEVFISNSVVIEPFSVPKRYEEAGVTADAMSQMIGAFLEDMNAKAHSSLLPPDRLSLFDESSVPDIEVPGTSLDLRTIVDAARRIFHREPERVRGAIALPLGAAENLKGTKVEITLWILDSKGKSSLVPTRSTADDPRKVAQEIAETILGELDPYLLGCSFEAVGRWGDAIDLANKIIWARPDQQHETAIAKAHFLIGNVLGNQGKDTGAAEEYATAIQHDPSLAAPYFNLGLAFENQGRYGEAAVQCQRAIELGLNTAPVHHCWARALAVKGDFEKALTHLQIAVGLDSKYAMAETNLGIVLANLGRNAEAIPHFQNAIKLDPNDDEAYESLGDALSALGKTAEARQNHRLAERRRNEAMPEQIPSRGGVE